MQLSRALADRMNLGDYPRRNALISHGNNRAEFSRGLA